MVFVKYFVIFGSRSNELFCLWNLEEKYQTKRRSVECEMFHIQNNCIWGGKVNSRRNEKNWCETRQNKNNRQYRNQNHQSTGSSPYFLSTRYSFSWSKLAKDTDSGDDPNDCHTLQKFRFTIDAVRSRRVKTKNNRMFSQVRLVATSRDMYTHPVNNSTDNSATKAY
jgi:hypothetical protein